jgi:hypothetical protein
MGKPTYWLDLFTGTTWQEFLDAALLARTALTRRR